MSNPNIVPMAGQTQTWHPEEVVTEETIRRHLSTHLHELTAEITKLEVAATKLDDLRVQLGRAEKALAAFNATYPDEVTTPADEFACPDCPRRFQLEAVGCRAMSAPRIRPSLGIHC